MIAIDPIIVLADRGDVEVGAIARIYGIGVHEVAGTAAHESDAGPVEQVALQLRSARRARDVLVAAARGRDGGGRGELKSSCRHVTQTGEIVNKGAVVQREGR